MRRREFLIAGAACGLGCSRRTLSPLRKLRVSAPMTLSASSLHLSYELGYFRQAGLEVEIVPLSNSLQMIAAAAGGKLDAFLSSLGTAFLNAVMRGAPIRIAAGREIVSSSCRKVGFLCALRRSFPNGLSDLRVLKKKRVSAGTTVGFMQYALDEHLAQAGLSIKDVEVVNLAGPDAITAMLNGGVDAILAFDESILRMRQEELVFSRSFADLHPNFQYGFIFFGRSLLAADPLVGRRFLQAYFDGAREFVRGESPQYLKRFADYAGARMSDLDYLCRASFAMDGSIDQNSLRLFSAWALRRGFIPRPAQVAELIDLRFLGEASA